MSLSAVNMPSINTLPDMQRLKTCYADIDTINNSLQQLSTMQPKSTTSQDQINFLLDPKTYNLFNTIVTAITSIKYSTFKCLTAMDGKETQYCQQMQQGQAQYNQLAIDNLISLVEKYGPLASKLTDWAVTILDGVNSECKTSFDFQKIKQLYTRLGQTLTNCSSTCKNATSSTGDFSFGNNKFFWGVIIGLTVLIFVLLGVMLITPQPSHSITKTE